MGQTRSRWRSIACLCLLILLATLVAPSVGRAAAVADEVHYTFTSATSVVFDWRGTANDLRYGTTSGYGSTALGREPNPLPFSSSGPFWEAQITGLAPGATYHYSIGGGPDHVFSTAPTGNFRFAVIADVGDSSSYDGLAPIQSQIAADNPAFVLVNGDLTYGNDHGQQVVDQHFNDMMVWSQTAAYMPAWGNHEWDNVAYDDLRNYKGRFAFPNPQTSPNAPASGCCGEDWSWFDAGGVRFITYPEPFTGAWSDWQAKADPIMAAAQADPSIHFIVTAGHRPAYSTGNHAGSSTLAAILDGFGDKYSKYLVNFNGHSHDYERFHPIHRVTHITAAGGGATLEAPWQTTDSRTAYRAMHLEHVRVDVTASSLRIEAVCGPPTPDDDITCTRGEVIDSVTIMSPGTPPPGNQAPVVNAGADQSVMLPGTASLSGSVTDDGLPNPPGTVTTLWSKLSGPGTVTFANASAKSTTASFSDPGTYVLRLTANDSALTAADDLTVQVAAAGSSQAVDVAVAASSDDAEERGSSVDLASSDLELVTDGTTVQTVGLRFPGVAVPRGAVIQDAYVQFQTDEVSTDTASLTVQGQAADTATTFTTATRNVSSRPRTTASVRWTPPAWPTVDARGPDQRTPNLAPVVQEIINRAGWTSGNGLALIVTGTGRRTAEAYDGTRAPTLHIQYSS